MSISSIQSKRTYEALSSGYKINRAADDAAGLSISEKLKTNKTGFSVGSSNAKDGNNMIRVAEGALSGIQDALQRIRELALRSMNGLYGTAEKEAFQAEIEGLKGTIQGTAKTTSFNTMKLLDGSMADLELATNPQGGGLKIQLVDSTLESLGIADFDVTGNFSLDAIDSALERISSARSGLGAYSNRLDHTINYNDYAHYNLTAANSRIRDTDYGETMIKRNTDRVLQEYKLFAMKAKMNSNAGFLRLF